MPDTDAIHEFVQPNLHIALVHFPIALLAIGVVIELFSFLFRRSSLKSAGRWMILLGTIGAVPTVFSGLYAWQDLSEPTELTALQNEILTEHLYLTAGATAAFLVVVFLWIASSDGLRRFLRLPLLVISLGALAAMLSGSHHGGEAVYKHGVGVKLASTEPTSAPSTTEKTEEPAKPLDKLIEEVAPKITDPAAAVVPPVIASPPASSPQVVLPTVAPPIVTPTATATPTTPPPAIPTPPTEPAAAPAPTVVPTPTVEVAPALVPATAPTIAPTTAPTTSPAATQPGAAVPKSSSLLLAADNNAPATPNFPLSATTSTVTPPLNQQLQEYSKKLAPYAPPKQVHLILGGLAFAIAWISLALAVRQITSASDSDDSADAIAAALTSGDPGAAYAIAPSREVPAARFWLLTSLVAFLAATTGWWYFAHTAGQWDPKSLWNFINTYDTEYTVSRRIVHVYTGTAIAVLPILLALLARFAPRRKIMLSIFALLLFAAIALQGWLGVLMLFKGVTGPVNVWVSSH